MFNFALSPLFAHARFGKRLPHPLLALILVFVFVFFGQFGGGFLLHWAAPHTLALWSGANRQALALNHSPVQQALNFAAALILTTGAVILLVGLWVHWFERRPVWTLGFAPDRALQKYLTGLLFGFLMFAAALVGSAVFGYIGYEAGPANRQGLAVLGGVLLVMTGWLVQGASEELLFRGWLLPVIGARYRPWLGVLLSSWSFAAYHGLNPNLSTVAMLNLFLFGLFSAFYALREGSIWGVCAWHSMWNWAQGNLFGMEVSGIHIAGGILLNLHETGPDLITGGHFGPEGGLAVTAVLLAGIVAVLYLHPRKLAFEQGLCPESDSKIDDGDAAHNQSRPHQQA
jgi:hypothetical protein